MSFHAITSLVLTWALRLLGATWRIRSDFGPDGAPEDFEGLLCDGPVVFAFFHGQQLPMIYAHRNRGLVGMASESDDGELLARSIHRLGYRVMRGSTSRGAARAVREAVRFMRDQGASPCLAVDGPRGPRHQPHGGAMGIAALAKRPVIVVVAEVSRAWRLSSWDRFLIPKPFAEIAIRYRALPAPESGAQVDGATEGMGEAMRGLLAPIDQEN